MKNKTLAHFAKTKKTESGEILYGYVNPDGITTWMTEALTIEEYKQFQRIRNKWKTEYPDHNNDEGLQ